MLKFNLNKKFVWNLRIRPTVYMLLLITMEASKVAIIQPTVNWRYNC